MGIPLSQPATCQEVRSLAPTALKPISPYIRRVFQDAQGNYWLGTNDDGVARCDGKSIRFFTKRDGLAGNAVRAILQDAQGALWFATDGGVSRYHEGSFTNYTTQQGLSDNDCWAMVQDASGTFWVGTQLGLCRLEDKTFIPVNLPATNVSPSSTRPPSRLIWSLFVDQEGTLWVGTDGAGTYRRENDHFKAWTSAQGLAGNHISSIHQDRKGRMWFGFVEGGVSCLDGATIRSFGEPDGLPKGWCWTMLEDSSGDMLISVLGTGLLRYDGDRFVLYESEHPVLPTHVQSLYRDRQGLLWMGCSGGLFRQLQSQVVHVTQEGPWPDSKASVAQPSLAMKPFKRLVGGSWKVTALSGHSMVHTWRWGPGGHSVERWTTGEGAQGNPWRELIVYYEDPKKQTIQLLGISPYDSGISKGSITFEGSRATATIQLAQSRGQRTMQTVWQFLNDNEYLEKLIERDATGKWSELVSFRHVRISDSPVHDLANPNELPEMALHWKPFQPLLQKSWMGSSKSSGIAPWQTSMHWIPHANFLFGQVLAMEEHHPRSPEIHFYLYRDTPNSTLHGLALADDGQFYQGTIEPSSEGSLQFVQSMPNSASSQPIRLQLQPSSNGTILLQLGMPSAVSSAPLEFLLQPSPSKRR